MINVEEDARQTGNRSSTDRQQQHIQACVLREDNPSEEPSPGQLPSPALSPIRVRI